ncbi:filamentous hemagglutinin family N-terminal domain-containing protein [Paraburkholderia fungorum]|uniref:Filamentous hemagglutinin family N-terminal domain-containing protein n=1 Tax=Paraburkholderia fungorum TaxID=134537 RepID=A0A1H1JS22_9BURK|nr:filamentous hemagglutinin N-terminal domain-containing protein [Paraburkholderia fungorum]SDR52405.1 filamentous hemagglutinin family N-terminal domain-containing protein [Paraburkholderia fungorum]
MSCQLSFQSLPHNPANRRRNSPGLMFIGLSLAGLMPASIAFASGVLPQGGHYVSGQGSIAASGNNVIVTQPGSSRGVIDWRNFSIGSNNTVTFDNGSGATLNRVTGMSPSAILGRLSATGSVYLINPQGIVVGPSGVISTGGRFVASTLDVCNCAFMNGDTLTLSGQSNAAVINLGKISSSGGDVFLVARRAVVNTGTVSAPNGTAEFAVGQQVLLQDSSSSRQVFVQTGSNGSIADTGTVRAAQINLEAADGNIYALAGGGSRLRASGTATRDGHVWLVADGGLVDQRGKIVASNADGSGGTVDTQAARLAFGDRAVVTAAQWNLSTPAFTIDPSAAGALQRSLNAGTSVAATASGANGATGDLDVAASLRWNGPASLTLAAYHDVSVASGTTLANQGTGNLNMRADATAIDNGSSVVNNGTIDWSASTGNVSAFYDMNGTYSAGSQLANAAWVPGAYSGLVTQITAYKLVNSLTDLKNVALDLGGNYALGADIDASASSNGSYVPLGNAVTPFTGQFDGEGHTINALTLEAWTPSTPYDPQLIGMFGSIGGKGVVRNLNLNGTGANNDLNPLFGGLYADMGMLAGENAGTVVRVNVSGTLSGGNFSIVDEGVAGGLTGDNTGTILRSSSSVAATTGGTLGGLAGANEGSISQSFATGALVSSGYINEGAGGLVGINFGSISQSYATGPTTLSGYCRGAAGTPCGGAALVAINNGTISQSFATGLVTQPFYEPIGVARTNTGTIANDVYWNQDTTGATVGVVYGTTIPAANGLTSAQMSTPASFQGYDFSSAGVWAMPAGATHPVLRWQLTR